MRNSIDFSKIEVDGKLLSVLYFNLMIPIEKAQLQPIDSIVKKETALKSSGNVFTAETDALIFHCWRPNVKNTIPVKSP